MKELSNFSGGIIGGADGPTSVFIAKSNKTGIAGFKRKLRKLRYEQKRKRAIAKISPNPHTMEELIAYITDKYQAERLDETSHIFQYRKNEMRANLVQRFEPELLEKMPELTQEDLQDEQKVNQFLQEMNHRHKKAASLSDDEFYIDYDCYRIKRYDSEIELEMEKSRGFLTSSWSGKGKKKKLNKVVKDIFLYYGVSEEDIQNNTERYQILVSLLCTD